MNLWVRTLRQLPLLVAAFFFFSCEDETNLLGYPSPNKKFEVQYVEIPLDVSSVLMVDSVKTDLAPNIDAQSSEFVDGLLVGAYNDPLLGQVEARAFMTLYPVSSTALPESAVYDSVTVQFRLNFFAYGGAPEMQTRRFAIHQITGDTLTFFNGNRYYSTTEGPTYNPEPLGYAVVRAHYDSLFKQSQATVNRDTVLARGRLLDSFGMQLFNAVKSTVDQEEFKFNIKGLAAVPAEPSGILGFDVVTSNFGQLSRVELHFHTLDDQGAVDDTLSRAFGVNYPSFSQITADRTGTALATAQPYASFVPDNDLRYVQSGAPVATKIDLSPFYAFADTVEHIQINQAELVIEGVTNSSSLRPHQQLMLRLMKNDKDEFLNNKVAGDRELGLGYYVGVPRFSNYVTVASEGTTTTPLVYDGGKSRFSGFVTLFAQSMYMKSREASDDERLRYVALYPAQPQDARSVARTVFSKNSVRLKIHYTRSTNTTAQ